MGARPVYTLVPAESRNCCVWVRALAAACVEACQQVDNSLYGVKGSCQMTPGC